jgi:hypothetical protein
MDVFDKKGDKGRYKNRAQDVSMLFSIIPNQEEFYPDRFSSLSTSLLYLYKTACEQAAGGIRD